MKREIKFGEHTECFNNISNINIKEFKDGTQRLPF